MKKKLLFINFFLILFLTDFCFGQSFKQRSLDLLYVKKGDPSNWTTPNAPSSQYKEITIWEDNGYSVNTQDIDETNLTEELLNSYDVVRVNGQYGGSFTSSEVNATENWVNNGGKLFLEIPRTALVNIAQPYGLETIEGENGGGSGLNWYFHGAPWTFGPITGPEGVVSTMASQVMDHPILATNNNLTIDCEVGGYPVIAHKEFGLGKVVLIFTEGWSQDVAPPGNAYRANIYQEGNIQFIENVIQYFNSNSSNNLLYVKKGDPSNWTTPNAPSSQYKEITIWEDNGYSVNTQDIDETNLTEELLNSYDVVRVNGQYGGTFTSSEVNATENWVNNGGKLFLEIPRTALVNIAQPYGLETIEGENGGGSGLNWYFHGAPWTFGPITGPEGVVSTMASQVMDHPILATNNNLTIDCEVGGYPVIAHKEFGLGKVVLIFTEGWSQDVAPPGNAYRANIYQEGNIEFLENVIEYFNSILSIDNIKQPSISMNVFPNPVMDVLNIMVSESSMDNEISIYNIAGRMVYNSMNFDENILIDIANLSNGLYIIHLIQNNNIVATSKIIKQ